MLSYGAKLVSLGWDSSLHKAAVSRTEVSHFLPQSKRAASECRASFKTGAAVLRIRCFLLHLFLFFILVGLLFEIHSRTFPYGKVLCKQRTKSLKRMKQFLPMIATSPFLQVHIGKDKEGLKGNSHGCTAAEWILEHPWTR